MLRIDGPEADGTVRMTEADTVGIDPSEAGCFDGILVRGTQGRHWGVHPFYSLASIGLVSVGKEKLDIP